MRRILGLLILALVLLTACKSKEATDKGFHGYASIYPVYDLGLKIAGDKAQIEMLLPMGADAHDWEPSVGDMRDLEEADFLIINGLGFEGWVDSVISSLDNKLVLIQTSLDIEPIKDELEHQGHDHGGLDPHIWISPANGKKMMENIAQGISEIDQANGDYYMENYKTYEKKFDDLEKSYREGLGALENKTLLVSHSAFGYLAEDYGLKQVSIEGLMPESEPTPKGLAAVVDLVREEDIKAIFVEEGESSKTAEAVAAETGIEIYTISNLETISQKDQENGEDYFSIMERNLETIVEGLSR